MKYKDEMLNVIQDFIDTHSYSPSMRELAGIFNKSVSTIYSRLKMLKKNGYITFDNNKFRTIQIVKK